MGRETPARRIKSESGVSRRLYDLRAEYVLLFINNPGCPMCREIHEAIEISPVLRRLIADGRLKVLAFSDILFLCRHRLRL